MYDRKIFIPILAGGATPTYSISGTVYDADGTTAVSGATVALGALSTTSAADGTYTIANVPAGTSGSMICTKAGYSWTAITVAAMAGNLTSQNYVNAWWAATGIAALCVRAYRGIGAANQAASYVNLANPGTGDAVVVGAGAIGWAAATGWSAPAAFTAALDTGLTIPNNTYSYFGRFSDAVINDYLLGWTKTGSCIIGPNNSGNRIYMHGGTNTITSGAVTSGVMAICGAACYLNGAADGTITQSAANSGTRTLYLLARNADGSIDSTFDGNAQAYAVYNTTLNSTQAAAVSAAMAALANP